MRSANDAARDTTEVDDGLVGKWFHAFADPSEGQDLTYAKLDSDGRVRTWQGKVVGREDTMLVVQLYSWSDGCPSNQRVMSASDMRHWRFYDSSDDLMTADGCGEDFGNRSGDGRTGVCRNPCTHVIRNFAGMGSVFRCWKCIRFYSGEAEEL